MKIAIIGAGAFGTAMAHVLSKNNHNIKIYDSNENLYKKILNIFEFSDIITPVNDIASVVFDADFIFLCCPSGVIEDVLKSLKPFLKETAIIVNAAKGILKDSNSTISQLKEIILDSNIKFCSLYGPSHAEEILLDMPTKVIASSKEIETSQRVKNLMENETFFVGLSTDVFGVEFCGTIKNTISIGIGLLEGLGFKENTKSIFITNCLLNLLQISKQLKIEATTIYGLSGLGDILATSYSKYSRNKNFGILISRGFDIEEAKTEVDATIEGIINTESVYKFLKTKNIKCKFIDYIYQIIFEDANPNIILDLIK
ncbi:MAG: NAD(P)H-dependent glycerol-3-phosphate dehydrogenase [Bacilli bacterium]